MVPAKSYRQDLPLGEGAPACRGGRGRRDAVINSDIPGEMVPLYGFAAECAFNIMPTAALGSFPLGKLLVVAEHFTVQRVWFRIPPGSGICSLPYKDKARKRP